MSNVKDLKIPTNYFVDEDELSIRTFDIEYCSHCGCEIETNVVYYRHPKQDLLDSGLSELPERLPRLYYHSTLGENFCCECY